MKKIAAVLAVVALVVSMASLVFAAGMSTEKGTIKSVNEKAGTVVFCAEGTDKDTTLKAEKGVDLSKVKAGEKVEVSIEKDMLKHMMVVPAAKPRPAVGC